MERSHHLTDAGSRVARTIRVRAERLARSGAVPGMDADDIAQDLRLDLVGRSPRYDAARASFETFADRVTANRIATLAAPTARLAVYGSGTYFADPEPGRPPSQSPGELLAATLDWLRDRPGPHERRRRSRDHAGRVTVFPLTIVAQRKILAQILRGAADRNIPFQGLCSLLRSLGFAERTKGSHRSS